ncbi:MAG: hypothetical protein FJW96_08315 [Actinobacteria bacterium]|nr:hypothetical protein [Actinomycetota bacterium]
MRVALVLGVVCLLVGAGAVAPGRAQVDVSVFSGLGTWIDVYDGGLLREPEALADRIAARGVRTVYVETANYDSAVDVVNAEPIGRLVDRLQALGVRAVGWYLPGFLRPSRDLRRALAMLAYRTPAGARLDAVALDIEALANKDVALRNRRLLALLDAVRAAADGTPVAAITYPPRTLGGHQGGWPGFPWAAVAARVDAWIPMAYSGGTFRGYDATYGYVARSLRFLRRAIGPDLPVHAAGGVANRMSTAELKAFADAVAEKGFVTGWSLYDLATTAAGGWKALEALAAPPP